MTVTLSINGWPGHLPVTPTRWRTVLSPNGRVHWRDKHACMKKDLEAVLWAARSYGSALPTEPWIEATVTIDLYLRTKGRRDADNLLASLKGVLDGIVQAGLIRDDDMDTIGVPTVRVHVDPARAYSYEITVVEEAS